MANPLTDVFGDTPQVAPYIKTIFSDEQLKALEENIAAFPQISQLGGDYYNYMLGMFNQAIPGFSDILAKGGDLTKQLQTLSAQELAGQIPQDVQDQLRRSTAFTSLGAGEAGSPMSRGLTARDFGLTSLDMIQRGAGLQAEAGNAAQRWAGLASGLMMNPSSFFITPQQQAALTMQNNLYKQATQQLRYNLAAAPDPVAKGVSDTIMSLIGAYVGHGMGGAGGGGGAGPSGGSVSGGAGGAGGMDLYNPNYNYGTQAGGPVTPDASGVNVNAAGGGGGGWFSRLFGGGGGGAGGGGGVAQTTAGVAQPFSQLFGNLTPTSAISGVPQVGGWDISAPGQQFQLDPNAFNFSSDPNAMLASSLFDPTGGGMSLGTTSGLFGGANDPLAGIGFNNYGGAGMDISSLLGLTPTGTDAFSGTNTLGMQATGSQIDPFGQMLWGGGS
jgi:hypothetical protein